MAYLGTVLFLFLYSRRGGGGGGGGEVCFVSNKSFLLLQYSRVLFLINHFCSCFKFFVCLFCYLCMWWRKGGLHHA